MADRWTRRQVIRDGAIAAAGIALTHLPRTSYGALGANGRIRMAVVGINGRGKSHINAFAKMKGVEIAYLVDPDSRLFADRSNMVKELGGNTPKVVQDVRQILDDKSIDAISIATPNHWHSLMTIWACQAGKDVYVEKPMSHNIHEGRIAVEVAKKYNRIVQHGTQRRSDPRWAKAVAAIQSGKLGKLLVARGLCYKDRMSIGFEPVQAPPAGLDFDLWTGPGPKQPYHANLVHYDWHWFWDFGNGDIGNQGVHQMDVALWGIKGATLPKSVVSVGGRFGYEDQGQTPNTQMAVFDFGETKMIFEVRRVTTNPLYGANVGNIFHMEAGTIVEHKFFPKGSKKPAPLPEMDAPLGPGSDNYGNFIEAVRSRKSEDLNANLLNGHYSSALCHLANASYRSGEQVPFSPRTDVFNGDPDAFRTLVRMEEHIGWEDKLSLDDMKLTVGKKLLVDAANETVTNDAKAAAILQGTSRAPFVIPDKA